MKKRSYLIIGAGGTGGAIGAYLADAGQDVFWIARGSHLEAIRSEGLTLMRPDDTILVAPAKACTMEEYDGCPDVVFVCVKGYSIPEIIPFLKRIADSHTVIIPILNIYGTGSVLQEQLPGVPVMGGCVYVAAFREGDGKIRMTANLLRVVFGPRTFKEARTSLGFNSGEKPDPGASERIHRVLEEICTDLSEAGIDAVLSDDIRRDAMVKYSYISAQNACGIYYDIPAGPMQKPGKERDLFAGLCREIETLGNAMGITFKDDLAERNLALIDSLPPDMLTSMQRDRNAGKPCEIDGLVYEVPRLAQQYGLTLPMYESVVEKVRSDEAVSSGMSQRGRSSLTHQNESIRTVPSDSFPDSRVFIRYEDGCIRIRNDQALHSFLKSDPQAAYRMAGHIRSVYKKRFGKKLAITRKSLVVEIVWHVRVQLLLKRMERCPGLKDSRLIRDLRIHMDVIDCGERTIDSNRFVWDGLSRFMP